MPGDLPNVSSTNVKKTYTSQVDLQTKEANLEKAKSSANTAKANVNEDNYVEMNASELSTTVDNIEEELSFIEMQMENIENSINSNAKIKESYEEEYLEIKKKIEEAQNKMESATTEEMQRYYQTKIFTLGQSLNLISTQIDAISGIIETKSETQQTLQSNYKSTYSRYENAANALNSKVNDTNTQNSTASSLFSGLLTGAVGSAASEFVASAIAGSNISGRMLGALKGWEGLRTTAYKCPAGVWTIGYGHTGNVSAGQQISEQQAENLLVQDLAKFEKDVTSQANAIGLKLTQGQYDSLVSFAYNCGGGALKKSGIMQMLKNGDIDGAANKMKQYCHGGGKVLAGLVTRRNIEASWLYT